MTFDFDFDCKVTTLGYSSNLSRKSGPCQSILITAAEFPCLGERFPWQSMPIQEYPRIPPASYHLQMSHPCWVYRYTSCNSHTPFLDIGSVSSLSTIKQMFPPHAKHGQSLFTIAKFNSIIYICIHTYKGIINQKSHNPLTSAMF